MEISGKIKAKRGQVERVAGTSATLIYAAAEDVDDAFERRAYGPAAGAPPPMCVCVCERERERERSAIVCV